MSKRSKTIYIVVGLVLLATAWGVYSAWPKPAKPTSSNDPYRPKATGTTSTQPSTASVSPTVIPTSTTPQSSEKGEVVINSPTQGASVTSGTIVSGKATTASTRLYYRLKGGKSGQLALGSIAFSGDSSKAVDYKFELAFTNQVAKGGDQGVLEVFTLGADGSEQTVAGVTVNIQP